MAVITRITTQKNNRTRYSIYIDNGKGEQFGFGVDEDVLIQFELRKGLELDDELIAKIAYEDNVKRALHLCYSFLSYRMRSGREVEEHLRKKGIEEPIITEVIAQLKDKQYINDLAFAESYVRDKKRLSTKGPLLLQKELREKGVKEREIEQALQEFPKEEQIEAAIQLVTKRSEQATKDSAKALRERLSAQLQQRGFTYEVITYALKHLPEMDAEEEMERLRYQAERAHRRYKKYTGFDYTQRMKQYLYRKGFASSQINEIIAEMEREQEDKEDG